MPTLLIIMTNSCAGQDKKNGWYLKDRAIDEEVSLTSGFLCKTKQDMAAFLEKNALSEIQEKEPELVEGCYSITHFIPATFDSLHIYETEFGYAEVYEVRAIEPGTEFFLKEFIYRPRA